MEINPKHYNSSVPKIWYRILLIIHGLTTISAVTAAINDKPWIMVAVMGTGYVCDLVIRFIKEDNPEIDVKN